jgi:rhodanese-related sulfurtransferase
MKTIHPLDLEALIETGQPIEILDLRPRVEFEKAHIEGARSFPATEICARTLSGSRELLSTKPLYLVSGTGVVAQRIASNFAQKGLGYFTVVSGGMHAWQDGGLPVVRHPGLAHWIAERRGRIAALGLAA